MSDDIEIRVEPKPPMWSEARAIQWLRTKFDEQGYAIFPQVPDGTGARRRRTADAIMLSLWPSRGLHLYGIEYKRTRNDWRRELKNPAKADSIGRYCDFFVILAPVGVIPVDEVPAAWGLWEIDKAERLLRTKPPPENEHKIPVDLNFVAGLLRAAQNAFERKAYSAAYDSATYEKGFKDGKRDRSMDLESLQRSYAGLKKSVDGFEEASGIKLDKWNGGERLGREVLEALKLLSDPVPHARTARTIVNQAGQLMKAAEVLANTLDIDQSQ